MMNMLAGIGWIEGNNVINFPGLGIKMDPPKGITIGSFSIYFYGVIIALGLILAVSYAMKRSAQFGIQKDDIIDGVIWILPVSVICARLYYCIFQWSSYKDNLVKILYVWEGGLAIYGAVIGAAICVVLFARHKKISLGALLDLVALGFLIGQCIGRWGNFFNREAHGSATESFLRMSIFSSDTHTRGYYHPTFLYESLWNFVGFILLHFLSKKRKYDGQIALGYMAWYGLGRAMIEGLRADSLYIFKETLGEVLRVSQLVAALSCVVAVAVLVWKHFHPVKKPLFVDTLAAEVVEEETEETEEVEETEE